MTAYRKTVVSDDVINVIGVTTGDKCVDLRPRKDGRGYDLISGSVRMKAFRWNDPELVIVYANFSAGWPEAKSEYSTGRALVS